MKTKEILRNSHRTGDSEDMTTKMENQYPVQAPGTEKWTPGKNHENLSKVWTLVNNTGVLIVTHIPYEHKMLIGKTACRVYRKSLHCLYNFSVNLNLF